MHELTTAIGWQLDLDAIHESMRITDARGIIVRVNEAYCKLVERSRVELEGQALSCVYHSSEHHRVLDNYRMRISSPTAQPREQRQLRRWDGTQVWLDTSLTILQTEPLLALTIVRDITPLKTAERAMHLEKVRFSDVISAIGIGTWEWTIPTGEVTFNDRWGEIVGYRMDELSPCSLQTWIDLVHPDDLPKSTRLLNMHFTGLTESYECECRMRHKNGDWIWILDRGRVTEWTPAGAPLHMVGAHTDITERKRLEQQLRESEEHFRDLADSVPVMVWLSGPDMGCTGFNQPWLTFTGRALAEELGFGWTEGVHPEDRQHCIEHYRFAAAKMAPVALEYRLRRKDGKYRWVMDRGMPRVSPEGTLLGYAGGRIDITDRMDAEANLFEATIKLRQLAIVTEQSPVSIVLCDRNANITYVNRAFTEVTGYSREEVIGRNPRILSSGLMDPAIFVELWRTLTAGKPWRGEMLNRKKNGELYWEAAVIAPVQDSSGELDSYLAVKEDITYRKQAEQAVQQTNAQLQQALERAGELSRQADVANKAKSEFLANMSHEIRTPLNGVIGMTELLLHTEMTAEQRGFTEAVHASGEALLSLINDILDLSKIEAGKVDLEAVSFPLSGIVQQVIQILGPQAAAKELHLYSMMPPDLTDGFRGDPTRLRQILLNLTSNAIKFTSQGEVAITAEVLSTSQTETYFRFSVCDTGIGIPQQKLDKLFGKFTQLDSSTARQYGGTGLGLAISKQLVTLMGGEIGVESVEGEGSEFYFTLSLQIADAAPAVPEARKTSRLTTTRKVLIAEDNVINQRVALGLLDKLGVQADVVANGADAIRAASQWEYGAVFMDIQMPVLDGYEATRAIRSMPGHAAEVPIIAMTASALASDLERALAEGMNDFVLKPISIAGLADALRKWLPDSA